MNIILEQLYVIWSCIHIFLYDVSHINRLYLLIWIDWRDKIGAFSCWYLCVFIQCLIKYLPLLIPFSNFFAILLFPLSSSFIHLWSSWVCSLKASHVIYAYIINSVAQPYKFQHFFLFHETCFMIAVDVFMVAVSWTHNRLRCNDSKRHTQTILFLFAYKYLCSTTLHAWRAGTQAVASITIYFRFSILKTLQ